MFQVIGLIAGLVKKNLLDTHNKETGTVSTDEETFYIPEEDHHVPENSEESFRLLLKGEIDSLDSRGYGDILFNFSYNLYNKEFYTADCHVDELKTINTSTSNISMIF